eukprot:2708962-Alexandrium_andersonii.AAC.1
MRRTRSNPTWRTDAPSKPSNIPCPADNWQQVWLHRPPRKASQSVRDVHVCGMACTATWAHEPHQTTKMEGMTRASA